MHIVEKYKFIYQEISDVRRRQHDDISLLNQKLNWVLVSDILVFGFLLQLRSHHNSLYQVAAAFLLFSIFVCLVSLFARDYKTGPSIGVLHKKRGLPYAHVVSGLNKRIAVDVDDSHKIVRDLAEDLKYATLFLLLSVMLICIKFFNL